MTTAARYYDEYASFHADWRNLTCHEIGIPLIVLAIFALLEAVHVGPVDAGVIVGALILAFYFALDPASALIALVAFGLLYAVGRYVGWPLAVAALIVGWTFQFVGHVYEGRKPAFLTNVVHLLIGPLWICSLLRRAR